MTAFALRFASQGLARRLTLRRAQNHSFKGARQSSVTFGVHHQSKRLLTSSGNIIIPTEEESDHQSSSLKILQKISSLQNAFGLDKSHWMNRITSGLERKDIPLCLTIIGDHESAADHLLSKLIGEQIPLTVSDGGIHHIKYGAEKEQETFVSPTGQAFTTLTTSSKWLQSNNIEITFVSGTDAFKEIKDAVDSYLYKSDIILVVSDSSSIKDQLHSNILDKFASQGKQNIIFGLNASSSKSLSSLESYIQKRLNKTILSSPFGERHTQIFDIKDDSFISKILEFINSSDKDVLREQKSYFIAWSALKEVLSQHKKSIELIDQIQSSFMQTRTSVESWQKRVNSDFIQRDLGQLQGTLVSFREAVQKNVFNSFPFWKLFWQSDEIDTQLAQVLCEHPLVRIEHQMSFAMGSASESLRGQIHFLIDAIDSVKSITSSSYPTILSLLGDLDRLQSFLRKQLPPAGPDVDPYLLRNEVALFNQREHLNFLDRQIGRIVGQEYLALGSITTSFLASWYLGVPVAIGIPVAIMAIGGSMIWMNLRWRFLQRGFLNRLSRTQNGLKEKLVSLYTQEYNRAVVAPIQTSTIMIMDAIKARKEQLAIEKDQILELVKDVENKAAALQANVSK